MRRVKESLWSVFGFNRIKPFGDNYSKDQMLEWKKSGEVQLVHDELYNSSVPDDPSSDTFITIIIKSVFTNKELTRKNAVWVQAVLETIFDVEHTSSKMETEVIDAWVNAILESHEEQVI